jgi:hypothetical protein
MINAFGVPRDIHCKKTNKTPPPITQLPFVLIYLHIDPSLFSQVLSPPTPCSAAEGGFCGEGTLDGGWQVSYVWFVTIYEFLIWGR